MSLPFVVSRKFGQSASKVIATFSDDKDARVYLQSKAVYDHKTKVDSIYTLVDDSDVVLLNIESKNFSFSDQTDSQNSSTSGSGFNPNPFSTTAKPPGLQSNFTNTKKDSTDEDL